MTTQTAPGPVTVPAPNPWVLLLQSLILAGLSAAGITDGALPTLVRAAVPPAGALVIAVLFAAHHWSLRGAQAVVHDLALTAQSVLDTAPGIPAGVRVSADNFAQVITAVGQYVESQRQGVPVSGPAAPARHAAPADPLTVVLPAIPAPAPAADPILAGLTETGTVAAGTLPPVPTSGAQQ